MTAPVELLARVDRIERKLDQLIAALNIILDTAETQPAERS